MARLSSLGLESCIKEAEELTFRDDYEVRKLRRLEKVVDDNIHVLEERNDEMYSSRFFKRYQTQKENLRRLKEIVNLKNEMLRSRVVVEIPRQDFNFITYLNNIETSDAKQIRVINILKGGHGKFKWQDRFEKTWEEIEKISDKRFLEQLKEGIEKCISQGRLAEKFRNSYTECLAQDLIAEIKRKLKG